MINEIQQQIDNYWSWLKEKTTLKQFDDDWISISTPYLDRYNDFIQLYVKRKNANAFILSDDGYTIADLEQSGCNISSGKRQDILKIILNGFGVTLSKDGALEVAATKETFPLRKHSLVQAILSVNDMFYLSSTTVTSLFSEDVELWLDNHDIRYSKNISFYGQSHYIHNFDFVIPKSKKEPERVLKVINNPRRDAVQALAFAWIDTKVNRDLNSTAYAILNDAEQKKESVG
jgi:Domain of unknown function DUF1828./Domain of unknown function DUF1829.